MAVPCYEEGTPQECRKSQRAGKVGNRACSARTPSVNVIERMKINVHAAFQAKVSGQLPDLGLTKQNLFGLPQSA
jgi:hypothetical protein